MAARLRVASGEGVLMKCPSCGHEWTATHSEMAAELGRRTSERKTEAARRNAKKGGWPKGKPRKPKIETENRTELI